MSSRAEQKQRLREERQQREREAAQQAARRRRLGILAGVAGAAVAVVVALVVLGGSDDSGPKGLGGGEGLTGAADTRKLMSGIPQKGAVLGKADAPVTLVEYVDLQCPFCAQYATQVAPTLIDRYVRTGKLRIEQRTVRILGAESELAANYAAAAGQRDKLFQFNELFFRNQGQENSGYVTPEFLAKVGRGAGLDPKALERASESTAAQDQVDANEQAFGRLGLTSTPSFLLGKTGADPKPLQVSNLTPQEFTDPIDRLLGGGT